VVGFRERGNENSGCITRGISRLAVKLLASQERLCSMELVSHIQIELRLKRRVIQSVLKVLPLA
jgi:hypothetical protein